MSHLRFFRPAVLGTVALFVSVLAGFGLAAQTKADYHLSLIHVNDTHSHFEPALTKLVLDLDDTLKAKPVYLELGGFPQIAEAIKTARAASVNPLVIHAGDFFQGTLYFTKYVGEADVSFWNLVGLDAATLGNHEFDKGSEVLKSVFLEKVKFPVVAANVDMTKDALLAKLAPAPYKVLTLGGAKIGVVGAVTQETPYISSPGKGVSFGDPVPAIQKAIDALTKSGVNKIVLVSHLGTDLDIKTVPQLDGVDLVVTGHTHSLLGDWKSLGLSPFETYPVVLKDKKGSTTLVVSAWEWGKILGNLGVDFDAKGKVIAWKADPRLVAGSSLVQVYDLPDPAGEPKRVRFSWNGFVFNVTVYDGKEWKEASRDSLAHWNAQYQKALTALARTGKIGLYAGDSDAWALSRSYGLGVQDLQRTVVSQVGEDMKRALNSGPGPVVADAMRAWTGSQVAITNAGGIRIDFLQGPLTTAKVYEVIPFGNTLVTLKATSAQLKSVLEDAADFALGKYGKEFPANPVTYVSGIRFTLSPEAAKGSRVSALELQAADGSFAPLAADAVVSVVVNNFIAAGGDKYDTLATIAGKIDTGIIDAETFFAFVKGKTLDNSGIGERIRILK